MTRASDSSGIHPRTFLDCRLVLTCSHDSLFLRYPAIDSVAWPCLPHFRIPEPPCSLRLRLVVSKSWFVQYPVLLPDVGSALLDFDTCLDSLRYSSCGVGSGIKPQWGVCYCLVSVFPSLPPVPPDSGVH